MEIKIKECFIPELIGQWELQPVSRFARAAAEFVFLYSRQRGINRFPGLVAVFDWLREWPGVARRGFAVPDIERLRQWVAAGGALTESTLRQAAGAGQSMRRALAWSRAVNSRVAALVRNAPPFPLVRESLEQVAGWADILVCSVAPTAALEREWREHGLARYAGAIWGQEMGPKREQIARAAAGRRVLMVGDSPADLDAARAAGALFFPVTPGAEEASWELFYQKTAAAFRDGAYTGDALIARFLESLPEYPAWKETTSFADIR